MYLARQGRVEQAVVPITHLEGRIVLGQSLHRTGQGIALAELVEFEAAFARVEKRLGDNINLPDDDIVEIVKKAAEGDMTTARQVPGKEEWSPLMKRDWSSTRSVTQAAVDPSKALLHYWPSPVPAVVAPSASLRMNLLRTVDKR